VHAGMVQNSRLWSAHKKKTLRDGIAQAATADDPT
jgi:hypothetical protein